MSDTISKNYGQIQAVFVGQNPPINTTMIWYDTNVGVFKHKYYDTLTLTWKLLEGGDGASTSDDVTNESSVEGGSVTEALDTLNLKGLVTGSVWKNNGGAGQYNLEAGKFNIIVHSASNIEMFLPDIEEDATIIVQGTTQGGVGSVNFTINGIENSGADLGTPLSVTITDEKEVLVFFCNHYGWHLISRTNPSAATSIPVYSLSQQSSGSSTYDVTIAGATDRTKLPDQYFIVLDAVTSFPLGYTIAMNVNGGFTEDIYKGFNPEKFQEAPQADFKYLVTKLGDDSYVTIAPNYSDALFDANGGVLPLVKIESNPTTTPLVLTSVNGVNSFQPPQVLGELLYYFTSTASDVASSYKQLHDPQVTGTTLSFSSLVHDQLITKFYSEPNNPNRLSIPAGTYQSHLHAYKSAGTKNLAFRVEVWEVDSAGVDIAKIVDIGASSILGGSLSEQLTATSLSTEYSLTSRTSRICHKYYAVVTSGGSAPTMVIAFGGGNDSHSNLPAPIVDSSNFVPYTGMSSDLETGAKDIIYTNATPDTPAWFDSSKKFITGTFELFGAWFNTASNKTPVDADKINFLDSGTFFGVVKTSLLNLWDNYLKVKADALYLKLSGGTVGTLTFDEFFKLNSTTNSTLTGSNQRLTGLTKSGVKFTNASLVSIGSIDVTGVTDGQVVIINNNTGNWIVLVNNYASATAAERIYTGNGSNATIQNLGCAILKYSTTSNGWSLMQASGITGTGTANRIPKFNAGNQQTNSLIWDNGVSIGLGTTSPNASALIDMQSTTQGFAGPRGTMAQRLLLTPFVPLEFYQTDGTEGKYVYSSTGWKYLGMSGNFTYYGLTLFGDASTNTQRFSVFSTGTVTKINNVAGSLTAVSYRKWTASSGTWGSSTPITFTANSATVSISMVADDALEFTGTPVGANINGTLDIQFVN